MSAGPLEEYTGTSGVADEGGDSLTADLNVYYSVRCTLGSLSQATPTVFLEH